jgi:hypothetical protein
LKYFQLMVHKNPKKGKVWIESFFIKKNFKKHKLIEKMKTDKILFKETWGTEHSSHLCCFEIASLARTNSHSLEKTLRWGHCFFFILNS